MDQDMWKQVSDWIMTADTTATVVDTTWLSWTVDPMQEVLSGVTSLQQQLTDWLSGLNAKLDQTQTLLEDSAKPKTPSIVIPKQDTTIDNKKPGTGATTWA